MKRLFNNLAASLKKAYQPRPTRRAHRSERPCVAAMVEILEGRRVMSAAPITDLTQWAQQFPAPTHTQNLILNFDGKHNDGQNIAAFVAPTGQSRDAVIQDVIYQVQEMFSPFNVRVERGFGDGIYSTNNGDTTIFIGGDAKNVLPTTTGGSVFTKLAASFTPSSSSDYATSANLNHAPNSDLYDLAFVDPMSGNFAGSKTALSNGANWTDNWSDSYIAANIAHEAGHTFGLPHVRTDGFNDPTPLGASTLGDLMSYNTSLPQTFFANRSLPVTNFNYVPGTGTSINTSIQPVSHWDLGLGLELPIPIKTENTFTYLQTILGKHYSDGYDHVTDPKYVDPSSTNQHAPSSIYIGSGYLATTSSTFNGVMDAHEGFVGFQVSTGRTKQFHIDVSSTQVATEVMVKDSAGNLLFYNTGGFGYGAHSHIDFQGAANQTYYVIVGNQGYNSWGQSSFALNISSNEPVPVITGSRFTFMNSAVSGMRLGQLTVTSEDVNTGRFGGVYTDMMGFGVPVSGSLSNIVTNGSGSVTTSDFSFSASAYVGPYWAVAQFSGRMTSNSGTSRHDTVTGTLVDQVFLMPYMAMVWNWGGPSNSQDF